MQQFDLLIVDKQLITPTLWQITLQGSKQVTPPTAGQFYLAQCGDTFSAYLRRAIFPSRVPASEQIQVIVSLHQLQDLGFAWLLSRQPGQRINVLGPLGRGFAPFPGAKNLLFLSDTGDIGPFLNLTRNTIRKNADVVLALEALKAGDLYPPRLLPANIELKIATLDGSLGHQGSILDHLDDLTLWADALYAIGSLDFYQRLKTHLQRKRPILAQDFAQVLVSDAPIHVCGAGLCTLCRISTAYGPKMACSDGPVFDLATLSL